MKRCATVLLIGAVLLTGCQDVEDDLALKVPSIPSDRPMMPGEANSAKDGKKAYVLLVRVKLVTIEVPVGMISGSEEIWSYLDEEPIRAARSAALNRNGVRIGLGRQGVWRDVADILRRMTGREIKKTRILAIPGAPTHIVLREKQPIQTIFLSYEDRTLSGADYPPGDNLLTVSFTLDREDQSKVLMTALPQIRSSHRKTAIVNDPAAGFSMVTRPLLFGFEPLTFQLTVPGKDFVVIGPSYESRRPSSVGHHFLLRRKEGITFEKLLVLMPEVVAAPVRRSRAAGGTPGRR